MSHYAAAHHISAPRALRTTMAWRSGYHGDNSIGVQDTVLPRSTSASLVCSMLFLLYHGLHPPTTSAWNLAPNSLSSWVSLSSQKSRVSHMHTGDGDPIADSLWSLCFTFTPEGLGVKYTGQEASPEHLLANWHTSPCFYHTGETIAVVIRTTCFKVCFPHHHHTKKRLNFCPACYLSANS